MQTVLPYLQAHKRTAEVWPELTEISTAAAPAPGEKLTPDLMHGWPLTIRGERTPFFRLRDAAATNQYKPTTTDTDARALTETSARRLSERFGNSGTAVLVVGHSVAGAALIRYLAGLGSNEQFWLRNASVSHLRANAARIIRAATVWEADTWQQECCGYERVRMELLEHLGYLPAEGPWHQGEYYPSAVDHAWAPGAHIIHVALDAVLHKDCTRLRQAIQADPLTGAALTLPQIAALVDELRRENAEYLREYEAQTYPVRA